MRYLIKNPSNNIIEMAFETPITPSAGLNVIPVDDVQWRGNMLGSIFIDVNNYKPRPSETYWESNGTNWVDNRSDDKVWEEVRGNRNEELLYCDWTQLDDSSLTPPNKGLWTAYRNVLRNVPNNNPNNPRAAETALKNAMRDDKPVTNRSA